jgi:hypothetical protein
VGQGVGATEILVSATEILVSATEILFRSGRLQRGIKDTQRLKSLCEKLHRKPNSDQLTEHVVIGYDALEG